MADDKNHTIPEKTNQESQNSFIELVEKLARLEHDQWIHYSKDVAARIKNADSVDSIVNDTVNKWSPKWIDYSFLSDTDKDKDRVWAYKVLQLLKANKSALKLILAMD
jgi:hypothetical protein